MHGKKMTVWSTKYALTAGIEQLDVIECLDHAGNPMSASGMVEVVNKGGSFCTTYLHGLGKDYHLTKKGAILRTLQVAKKNQQALNNKIKKIADTIDKLEKDLLVADFDKAIGD